MPLQTALLRRPPWLSTWRRPVWTQARTPSFSFARPRSPIARTTGRIFEVGVALTYLEDPGRPIPPPIVELTGITDEAVAGKRIDEDRVAAAVSAASLVIAHNASFDRRFVERRLPYFADKSWACSQQEVSWARLGSAKLEYLMIKRCNLYFAAHSADQDCSALIHMLATPLDSGGLPMRLLLESARRASIRIYAVDSPFEKKDLLKARRTLGGPHGRRARVPHPFTGSRHLAQGAA
jgi:DNA polymerase III subunit epsilon